MDLLRQAVDLFLHLDRHLAEVIERYGALTYLILFGIVFCETGLVVTPFLPGDSLLFAAGAFAAVGALDLGLVCLVLALAAILGDTVNYAIGRKIGVKVFLNPKPWIFKREHLVKTQRFYEQYGAKTIVIARFVPIVRTFAPFVAGVGTMRYGQFVLYNVVGALLWVATCVLAGYFFGNLPFVREHFSLVVLAIIVVSILPGVVEAIRVRRQTRTRAVPPVAS